VSPRVKVELRRAAKACVALVVCEVLTYALDRVTIGSSRAVVVAWAVVALVTLALRLMLLFVVPGWLLSRALIAWVESRRA
jgi:hypothetical protein